MTSDQKAAIEDPQEEARTPKKKYPTGINWGSESAQNRAATILVECYFRSDEEILRKYKLNQNQLDRFRNRLKKDKRLQKKYIQKRELMGPLFSEILRVESLTVLNDVIDYLKTKPIANAADAKIRFTIASDLLDMGQAIEPEREMDPSDTGLIKAMALPPKKPPEKPAS